MAIDLSIHRGVNGRKLIVSSIIVEEAVQGDEEVGKINKTYLNRRKSLIIRKRESLI